MTEIGKLEIPVTQKQGQDGVRKYTCGAKGEKGWLFVDEISVN